MPLIHTETNKSPLYCKYCKQHLSKYQERQVSTTYQFKCRYCNVIRTEFQVAAKVAPSSVRHMKIGAVRDSMWYHATKNSNWHEDKDGFDNPVYIGTRSAANRRWSDLTSGSTRPFKYWMYKVRLKDGVKIHPRVLMDDYVSSGTVQKAHSSAVRFVNLFESPGSISIALPGEFIEIIDCKEL